MINVISLLDTVKTSIIGTILPIRLAIAVAIGAVGVPSAIVYRNYASLNEQLKSSQTQSTLTEGIGSTATQQSTSKTSANTKQDAATSSQKTSSPTTGTGKTSTNKNHSATTPTAPTNPTTPTSPITPTNPTTPTSPITPTNSTTPTTTPTTPTIPGNSINVKNYGAIGNGVADDTAAFRAAIAAATSGKTIGVPAGTYKISSTIDVKSGITLIGESSALYMPPKGSSTAILDVGGTNNVSISGIKLISDSTNEYTDSLVVGINSSEGLSDLTITNLRTENLHKGIKIGSGPTSYRIFINGWTSVGDDQSLYLANVSNSTFNNLNLNCFTRSFYESGYKNHVIYLERGNDGLTFNNIRVSGGTGQSIHMYHESTVNSKNIAFNHLVLNNPNSGIVVKRYNNVTFSDLVGSISSAVGEQEFFVAELADNIKIDGFNVAGGSAALYSNGSLTNVTMVNGTYHQSKFVQNQVSIIGFTTYNVTRNSAPIVIP